MTGNLHVVAVEGSDEGIRLACSCDWSTFLSGDLTLAELVKAATVPHVVVTHTERRLTCTECGAVTAWFATEWAVKSWRALHGQLGPDHQAFTTETRTARS